MEIKDNKLIIDMPKGMELDTENTDEAKGVIMLRKEECYLRRGRRTRFFC